MFGDIRGKTVVVTGGVTGIGGAAALGFAAAGANVLSQYLGGGPQRAAIEAAGIRTLQLDLTKRSGPIQLIEEAIKAFGHIDILVNNAGSLVARVPLLEVTDDFMDKVFDVNCRQLVQCCRLAAEHMIQRKSGCIINVSSIAARQGASAGGAVYAGAKGFVSSFTRQSPKNLLPTTSGSTPFHPERFTQPSMSASPAPKNAQQRRKQSPCSALAWQMTAPVPFSTSPVKRPRVT